MSTDKYNSHQLFAFLTEFQDSVTTGTANRLIAEFGADFTLEDIVE